MTAKDIKRGHYYQTTHGTGRVEAIDGSGTRTRVQITITGPLPLGTRYLSPREVQHEIESPTAEDPRS